MDTGIKAVLFDLDGTLRDSRAAIFGAIEGALDHFDIALDPRVYKREAHSLRAVHAVAATEVPYEAFRERYDMLFSDDVLSSIILYEHVVDVLEKLMKDGYKLALVSSSRFAREGLEAHGLTKYFEVVVGGNDVSRHKPDPEPIFLATQQLDVRAESVVMVGDMVADVEAGRAAGVMATVGLTHGFGEREDLEVAGADYIIDSLAELPALIGDLQVGVQ